MTSNESAEKSGYVQSVKIIDVEKRYRSGPKHYVFVIQVTWASPTNVFIIYRRYKQFYDLQCKLLDLFADAPSPSNESRQPRQIPFLPGKIIIGRSQIRQIAVERQRLLNEYCQALISLPDRVSRSRPIVDFFRPNESDVQKPRESIRRDKKLPAISSLVIGEPRKLADYRCLNDFTASDKLEMTLKKDALVQVLQKHGNGWWFVQLHDQRGFVPGAYLVPTEETPVGRQTENSSGSLNEVHVVNKNYQKKAPDEISLDQGSFVSVIEKSLTGWWTVKFNGKIGQFPSIYLSSCQGRHTPDQVTSNAFVLPIVSRDDYALPSHGTFTCHFSRTCIHLDSSADESAQRSNDSDWDEEKDDDDDDGHPAANDGMKPKIWYAHSDFLDDAGDCLSFKRGDRIEIHKEYANGWWSGRGIEDAPVLTWIPASYLQKEPISDNPAPPAPDYSSDSEIYSNVAKEVPDLSIEKEKQMQPQEESIYESFDDEVLTPVTATPPAPPPPPPPPPPSPPISSSPPLTAVSAFARSPSPPPPPAPEVMKETRPIIPKIIPKKPPISTPITSAIKVDDGAPKSVKDLVKRFSGN